MTHDAWDRLRWAMPAANFPVVEQLGLAKIAAWPVPIWIYQVGRVIFGFAFVSQKSTLTFFCDRSAPTGNPPSISHPPLRKHCCRAEHA